MEHSRPTIFAFIFLALTLSACQSNNTTSQPAAPTPIATVATASTPEPGAPTKAGDKAGEQPGNGLKSTPSGLQYQDLVVGNGQRPFPGQTVRLRYTGWTIDGVKFDGNQDGAKPALEFKLGKSGFIKGWEIGVGGGRDLEPMRVGGKRKLVIPPDLGYGANPMGTIPPNSTLVFEIELIGVKGNSLFGGR